MRDVPSTVVMVTICVALFVIRNIAVPHKAYEYPKTRPNAANVFVFDEEL